MNRIFELGFVAGLGPFPYMILSKKKQQSKIKDSAKLKIVIYPNPFNSVINISSNKDSEVVGRILKLYDVSGKLYLTQIIQSKNTILNVSHLGSGIYILKIEGESGIHIYKVMKTGNGN